MASALRTWAGSQSAGPDAPECLVRVPLLPGWDQTSGLRSPFASSMAEARLATVSLSARRWLEVLEVLASGAAGLLEKPVRAAAVAAGGWPRLGRCKA